MVLNECLYVNHSRNTNSLQDDVLQGLLRPPRSLPAKYFYDERGSLLFDQICETDEYYPTRIEAELLDNYAHKIIQLAQPQHILEFGSGTSRKTHHLILACERLGVECEYLPFDVCEEMLHKVRDEFQHQYQWLDVQPLVGDYTAGLDYLHRPDGKTLYVFLGSSIGNFNQAEAQAFIDDVSSCMQSGDSLLLGCDRVKDEKILHNAYNDASGVTRDFNLNLLNVLNRELDADFELERFRHKAVYNSADQRIEMYLVSKHKQEINLNEIGETLQLDDGEPILTEVSHKYSYQQAESLLTDAGLHILRHIEPENAWFSLVLASKP